MAEVKKSTAAKKPATTKKPSTAKPAIAKKPVVAKPVTKPVAKTTVAKPAAKPAATKTTVKTTTAKPAATKAVAKTTTGKPAKKKIVRTPFKGTAISQLPASVFALKKISKQAIFDTVVSEEASMRQGTHKVKHRGEVRGGGKKPWAQKGTGRARAGSNRSPIWVGGGTIFGPSPERNYKLKVNKKVRKLALLSSLTLKAKESGVISKDLTQSKPSTKDLIKQLDTLGLTNWKVLIVTDNENVFKSSQNIQKIHVTKPTSLHIRSILHADALIIGKEGMKELERLAK